MPKKKMPMTRAGFMTLAAFFLSILIFLFASFIFTAPIIAGMFAAVYVKYETGSKVLEYMAGVGSGALVFIGDFFGLEVVIGLVGEAAAMILTIFGWTLFFFWFTISGISFMGEGKRANKRLASAMISATIGMVPVINIIPSFFVGVMSIIIHTYMEDKEKLALYKKRLAEYNKTRKNAATTPGLTHRPIEDRGQVAIYDKHSEEHSEVRKNAVATSEMTRRPLA